MRNNAIASERRATLLHAAAKVSKSVSSVLDCDQLLRQTVDVICSEFGFYYAGVFLLDETGEWAELRAGYGAAGEAMIATGHKLQVGGKSMIGTAISRHKAIIALDVGEEPIHFDNPFLPKTRSEMALPLVVGDQVIGALTVQSTKESAFNDDDITALQAMADQLAIAINNARLYDENRRLLESSEHRARLLEAAAEVGHGVTSILDLDELLSRTVDIICAAYGFYFSCVYLLDESGKWLILRAAHGKAGEQMLAKEHKLLVGGRSMNGTVAVQRKARIALDVDQDPVHMKNPLLPHTRSEMVMPLLVSNDIIGTLAVQSTEEAAFNEDDITTLQTMADQLAIAINNAQLLRDLKAAHAELVRTKTFEAIATSTIEAIHWIGNKALPISTSVTRVLEDLVDLAGDDADQDLLVSIIEDLDMIKNSADLIGSVKEHLIGPAREEKPRPAMLDDVVKDAAVMQGIPQEIVTYKVARDLPLAWADTTQLSRAFSYVFRNAMEAIEDNPQQQITVAVAPTEDRAFVAVSISDNGPGIPETDLEKIWTTFYTTKGTEHAGMGLSACLQIVKQLDGQVAARNIPGGGVQIEIEIPAFDGSSSAAALPADQSVLLVDDDDAWSRFIQATWTEAGSRIVRSPDGRIDPVLFDLIVVDDVLEQADSVDVLKRLRDSKATTKTLVVASSLRVERTMQLMHFGVKDIVIKPYTMAALAATVT
jgi:GAF domain-containing protein/anti-sigma regulatory factor (Ser/Thr protein kinase)